MSRSALITGICGQDGALLAAQWLERGDSVVGARNLGRGAESLWRLRELGIAEHPRLRLLDMDIVDAQACRSVVADVQPFALFHFAAQSRVAQSFRDPVASSRINAMGALHLLEALRQESAHTRFVLASTGEVFGDAPSGACNEASPLAPRNPYAVAKQFAQAMTQTYRAGYGLHASCAILFNHESPLRDADFVTRKIAAAAVRLARGEGEALALGNLAARRDFGYAPEYVAAMTSMVDQAQAGDYVLATGIATSIREFTHLAFSAAGIALDWQGQGPDESARDRSTGRSMIQVSAEFFRPLDAVVLVGDAVKARSQLGFAPATDVRALAQLMVDAELRRLR
jgi:GDPmannose 4,6-dehydratase